MGGSIVMARGQRRFEILSLDQEKDYLRGEVEYFEDEDPAPVDPGLRKQAIEALENSSGRCPNQSQLKRHRRSGPSPFKFRVGAGVEDLDFQKCCSAAGRNRKGSGCLRNLRKDTSTRRQSTRKR